MLLATPFLHIDKVLSKDGPPRIISEVKKSQIGVCKEQSRPRLSGEFIDRYKKKLLNDLKLVERNRKYIVTNLIAPTRLFQFLLR